MTPGLDEIQGGCPNPTGAEMSLPARAAGLSPPLSLGQAWTSSVAQIGQVRSVAQAGEDEFQAGAGLILVWMSCRCRDGPGLEQRQGWDDLLGPEFGLAGTDVVAGCRWEWGRLTGAVVGTGRGWSCVWMRYRWGLAGISAGGVTVWCGLVGWSVAGPGSDWSGVGGWLW